MYSYKLLLLGLFLSFSQVIIAQEKNQNVADTILDIIPFELTAHNNISVQAILNKVDTVHLMFHTAANAITLIKEATQRLTSMDFNQEDTINSWGGENTTRYSENNALQIGKFDWDNISIWENENSGPTTDGKFGPNLFENKVIEINFDKKVLIIHQKLPKSIATYEKLKLVFEHSFMFIEGVSRIGANDYPNRFLIHSGYGGTILYDNEFAEKSKIGAQLEILEEKELKDSYGNVLKTKKAKLPLFKIGKAALADIPVGFFEGSIGQQKMSVMGGDVLKRFNIIIDAKRAYIYLKPNNLKSSPYTSL